MELLLVKVWLEFQSDLGRPLDKLRSLECHAAREASRELMRVQSLQRAIFLGFLGAEAVRRPLEPLGEGAQSLAHRGVMPGRARR